MAINPYINLYGGEVTAGETDGIPISCDGSFSYPVKMLFDVSKPTFVRSWNRYLVSSPFAIRTAPGLTWENVRITFDKQSSLNSYFYLSWRNNFETESMMWDNIYSGYSPDNPVGVNKLFYVALNYTGPKYNADLDKLLDTFFHYTDTNIHVHAKICPQGYKP